MSKITVSYQGKNHELNEVFPGIVEKGNAFLIKCCKTGIWCYCSPDRIAKLATKLGSVEAVGTSYSSRPARAADKSVSLTELNEKLKLETAKKAQEKKPETAAPAAANNAVKPADGNKGKK